MSEDEGGERMDGDDRIGTEVLIARLSLRRVRQVSSITAGARSSGAIL
jgi:hypothetical protein